MINSHEIKFRPVQESDLPCAAIDHNIKVVLLIRNKMGKNEILAVYGDGSVIEVGDVSEYNYNETIIFKVGNK